MTNDELNEMLVEGIELGRWIGLLEEGELKIYHIEHTDDQMVKEALPVEDVRRLLASGEAE